MRYRAVIRLELADDLAAEAVYRALAVEAASQPRRGPALLVKAEGREIRVEVESGRLANLRAALNSLLRIMAMLSDVASVVDSPSRVRAG